MSKGSAPQAPDPWQSAQAQYTYGTAAGNYSTALQRPNVVTPYGSQTWSTAQGPYQGPSFSETPYPGNPYTPTTGPSGPIPRMQPEAGGGFNAQDIGMGFGAGIPAPQSATSANVPGGTPATGASPTGESMIPMPMTGGALHLPAGYGAANGGSGAPNLVPPTYTETTSLSPAEQQLFNLAQGGQTAVAERGAAGAPGYQTNLGFMSDLPGFTDEAQQAAYKQQTQYLDPQFSQQHEQLDAQLRNSGAYPGTPAYDNAMTLFNNQKQQAYSNAEEQAVGQGLQEQQALFGEGESAAGFQNSAIENAIAQTGFGGAPSFGLGGSGGGTSGGTVNAPDVMGAFQNQYQGQLANYNSQVAQSNADVGAGAGLLSSYLMYLALA